MKVKLIYILLLLFDGLNPVYANFIQQNFESDKTIVLEDGTKLFWQNKYDNDFSLTTGFYMDDDGGLLFGRIVNGASDTTYINAQYEKICQIETMWSDEDYYQIKKINLSSDIYSKCKYYNKDKETWAIYDMKNDGSWQSGRKYSIDKTSLYDISSDAEDYCEEDDNMMRLCLFLFVYFAYAIVFPLGNFQKHGWVWFIVGLVLSLYCTFGVDKTLQKQLFLPLFSIITTSLFFLIPQYVGSVRYVTQFLLGTVIISIFAYKQFVDLDKTIKFADGEEVNVKWEKGTCLIKRHYIKRMLSDMTPVIVNSQGNEYLVYVSKYEFSEDDLSVVNDESLNWLNVFCKFNRPLYDFSFRESQIILEFLSRITGLRFDFLSYEEWVSASLYKKHSPNLLEYEDVDEGEINDNGLVNILGNMPEYTSNYLGMEYRVGLAADTIIKSYNNIIVAGSAYKCLDSINVSIVNKNIRDGLVGFRLVYRPDDIGARKFCIIGHLRSDKKNKNLPEIIKLVSIDGHYIEDMGNYESFEELLIECRFKNKAIEAIDLSNNKTFDFMHPKGFEYYDFEPQFSFVGF